MVITGNRHPVDELADTRAEIKRLEGREQELRAYLLEHPYDREGVEHVATVGEQRRKRVDLKGLGDEIGYSLLARFTSMRHASPSGCERVKRSDPAAPRQICPSGQI
jgi:hypothetical protein